MATFTTYIANTQATVIPEGNTELAAPYLAVPQAGGHTAIVVSTFGEKGYARETGHNLTKKETDIRETGQKLAKMKIYIGEMGQNLTKKSMDIYGTGQSIKETNILETGQILTKKEKDICITVQNLTKKKNIHEPGQNFDKNHVQRDDYMR